MDAERVRTRAVGSSTVGGAVRFDPGSSEIIVGSWVNADTGSVGMTHGAGPRVRERDLVVARAMLGMFRQLDHAHGAGQFAGHLASYIEHELAALLARPSPDAAIGLERDRLAAEFMELAGYQAVDAGRPGGAQDYYQRAVELAVRSGDRAYGGYLVAVNLGHLALHCNHADVALRWALAAEAGAGKTMSPATRAAVVAVAARARARMGEEQETTRLLLRAEALLDTAVPTDEPGWIGYFSRAYLADEIAHCLHDLGRAPAARAEVADALQGVGASHVRRLAIDAALLASTWLRSGDVEQACTVAREAVEYAARTSSGRCVERIAQLLDDLAPYAAVPAVIHLDGFVREALPAATLGRPTISVPR
jgi:hypothetical protein